MARPSFQAGYNITGITEDATPGIWVLTGDIVDNTPLNLSATGVTIGYFVYVSTYTGNIDQYIVTSIVSAVNLDLVCKVAYNEPGTPSVGGPVTGLGVVCQFPDQPPIGDLGGAEYLVNGIRNINAKLLTNTYLDVVTDTATGGDDTYTLTKAPTGIGQIAVYCNGVMQPPSSYSVVGQTLMFNDNVPAGWRISAVYPVHPYA